MEQHKLMLLLCPYIIVVIFFATHGNTIEWAYVGYVESYMDMKHYAWEEEILRFLIQYTVGAVVLIESLPALLHYRYDRQLPTYTYESEVIKNE